jgi:2-hydroxychromene-2-carboxylate isomerase
VTTGPASGPPENGNRVPIEFWFEFASTYSYPAALRIEKLATARGVSLLWRPFLLGPIFRAQGWDDSPFNLYPAKGNYMWRDLERICAHERIPFRRPTRFPQNGLLAARVACCFAREPWIGAFVRAVYQANFADDRDISDPAVLEDSLASLGQPAADVLASARTTQSKDRLRAQTEAAAAYGIFGAPSFVVDGELFWGNDRLEAALAWAMARPTFQ